MMCSRPVVSSALLLLLAIGARAEDDRVCANRKPPQWYQVPIKGTTIVPPVPRGIFDATVSWVTANLKKKKKLSASCTIYKKQPPAAAEACFNPLPKTRLRQWWGELDTRYFVAYKCKQGKVYLQVEAFVDTRKGGKIKSIDYDYQVQNITGR